MTVTITITASNAEEAKHEMQHLLGAGKVVHAVTVGEIELPKNATVDVGYAPAAAAESAASKGETITPIKKSRKKAEPKEEAPAPAIISVGEEEADDVITPDVIKQAEAIVATEKPVTRDEVKALMNEMHREEGDTFIPKVLAVLATFGVKSQRDVPEEHMPALYEKLCVLKKEQEAEKKARDAKI